MGDNIVIEQETTAFLERQPPHRSSIPISR